MMMISIVVVATFVVTIISNYCCPVVAAAGVEAFDPYKDNEDIIPIHSLTPNPLNPTPKKAVEIITRLGGNPDAKFDYVTDVLSSEQCQPFIDSTEYAFLQDGSPDYREDDIDHRYFGSYHFNITTKDMIETIGFNTTMNVWKLWETYRGGGNPANPSPLVTLMYVHRGSPSYKSKKIYVPWHRDSCYSSMEILLNDDFVGGQLLHLTRNGSHRTENRVGSAFSHDTDAVHTIPPHYGNARYSLMFKHYPERPWATPVFSEELILQAQKELKVEKQQGGQEEYVATTTVVRDIMANTIAGDSGSSEL